MVDLHTLFRKYSYYYNACCDKECLLSFGKFVYLHNRDIDVGIFFKFYRRDSRIYFMQKCKFPEQNISR